MGKTPLLFALLLAAACAPDTVTDEVIDATGDDLAAADDLLGTHARAVADATSVDEVRALEGALALDWDEIEADVLADLDAIEGCDVSDVGRDRIGRIRDALDTVRDEVDGHVRVNQQATTLADAAQEELLLQDRTRELLLAIDGERELLREDIRCVADLGEGGLALER